MATASEKKTSESVLGKTAIGTGALLVPQLFDVKGWVTIGTVSPQQCAIRVDADDVVTGGGTGLGLVTAAALAENGAKVYITGRRKDVLEAAAKEASPKSGPGKIIPIQADVATKEGIQSRWKWCGRRTTRADSRTARRRGRRGKVHQPPR